MQNLLNVNKPYSVMLLAQVLLGIPYIPVEATAKRTAPSLSEQVREILLKGMKNILNRDDAQDATGEGKSTSHLNIKMRASRFLLNTRVYMKQSLQDP